MMDENSVESEGRLDASLVISKSNNVHEDLYKDLWPGLVSLRTVVWPSLDALTVVP